VSHADSIAFNGRAYQPEAYPTIRYYLATSGESVRFQQVIESLEFLRETDPSRKERSQFAVMVARVARA